jgi:hypothetical protein
MASGMGFITDQTSRWMSNKDMNAFLEWQARL